jgi:hypothetical protein
MTRREEELFGALCSAVAKMKSASNFVCSLVERVAGIVNRESTRQVFKAQGWDAATHRSKYLGFDDCEWQREVTRSKKYRAALTTAQALVPPARRKLERARFHVEVAREAYNDLFLDRKAA